MYRRGSCTCMRIQSNTSSSARSSSISSGSSQIAAKRRLKLLMWPARSVTSTPSLTDSSVARSSALLASASAPFVLWSFGHGEQALVVALMAALLWWKHSENIARLLSGTESRIGQKT